MCRCEQGPFHAKFARVTWSHNTRRPRTPTQRTPTLQTRLGWMLGKEGGIRVSEARRLFSGMKLSDERFDAIPAASPTRTLAAASVRPSMLHVSTALHTAGACEVTWRSSGRVSLHFQRETARRSQRIRLAHLRSRFTSLSSITCPVLLFQDAVSASHATSCAPLSTSPTRESVRARMRERRVEARELGGVATCACEVTLLGVANAIGWRALRGAARAAGGSDLVALGVLVGLGADVGGEGASAAAI